MTDPAGPIDPEDKAILDALEALERDPAPGRGAGGGREARAYTELLGLLPWGLDPVEPSPEVKGRVMAAVRARPANGGASSEPLDEPPPAARFRRPSGSSSGSSGGGSAGVPAAVLGAAGAGRWLMPLAAALAALAFGLSGWLWARGERQGATIAELTRELAAATARADQAELARGELESVRRELAGQLALATSPGMVACPLKPMDEDHPRVRGLLFMTPGGGPWLLSVHGLEPPPEGRVYVAWFLHGDDPHPMGMLTPGADRSVQMTAREMPGHDSMTAVAVTLEPSPEVERPSGPTLLFGNERIEII